MKIDGFRFRFSQQNQSVGLGDQLVTGGDHICDAAMLLIFVQTNGSIIGGIIYGIYVKVNMFTIEVDCDTFETSFNLTFLIPDAPCMEDLPTFAVKST